MHSVPSCDSHPAPGRSSRALLALLLAGSVLACAAERPPLTPGQAADSLSLDTYLAHQEALSTDAMQGRRPGTAGYDSAAAYVIREAAALGLEPGGAGGAWRQPILFRRSSLDPEGASFRVDGQPLELGIDVAIAPRATATEVDLRAPLAFAGFGISAPWLGYDDLEGLDVAGKLVVVVAGAPESFGSLERTVLSSSASRDAELLARGAAGVVTVQVDGGELPPTSRVRTRYVLPDGSEGRDGGDRVAAGTGGEELQASLSVSARVASDWMAGVGRSWEEVLASIRSGTPASFDLEAEGHLQARFRHEPFESPNVAALLTGADPELRDEHLVLTAHLDHLGVGDPIDGDSIYNGTLDNASGSSALLTLASVLTGMEAPRRSILFLWVTAEESGLLGSEYFARSPTVEGRVVANQNVDGVMGMITATSDMLAFGYEHSNLSEAVDFAVARTGTPIAPDPTPDQNLFIRSDQYAFVRQGIPAIWVQSARSAVDPARNAQAELDAWIAERYHRPTDDLAQPMDLEGVMNELRTVFFVTHYIANEMREIRWDEESFLYQRFGAR